MKQSISVVSTAFKAGKRYLTISSPNDKIRKRFFSMKFLVPVAFVHLLVLTVADLKGQSISNNSFVAEVTNTLTNKVLNASKGISPLYNGRIYHPHPKFKNDGHAFFNTNQYTDGQVVFDGITYKGLKLMYDLIRHELILLSTDGTEGVILPTENVNSFLLGQNQFVNITNEKTNKALPVGYYAVLYQGRSSLLAKKEKEVVEKIDQTIERVVSLNSTYYLLHEGTYHRIKGKNDLMKLFRSSQERNETYIKDNKLNFNNDLESAMISLVRFHDSAAQ